MLKIRHQQFEVKKKEEGKSFLSMLIRRNTLLHTLIEASVISS